MWEKPIRRDLSVRSSPQSEAVTSAHGEVSQKSTLK